ncbi:MAG: MFS transporter [Actinobacteria bacterium]|nr:MFS transporter [Actinomycetota bacterium]
MPKCWASACCWGSPGRASPWLCPSPGTRASSSLRLLEEVDARWLSTFYLVTFGGFVGLAGYLPIFFVDRFGLAKVTAAGYAALCAAAGSFLRPLGGALSDHFGGTRVLSAALLAVGVVVAGLASLPALGATVLLLFLALAGLGIGNGAVFQIVPRRFPTRIGTVTGLVGAAGGVGGFVLPFAFGALEGRTGSFATGFLLFALATGGASFAVAQRHRSWKPAPELEVAVA